MKYQIQSYQVIYATGQRDTVKLPIIAQPLIDDLEEYRKMKKMQHKGCIGINLTYVIYDAE